MAAPTHGNSKRHSRTNSTSFEEYSYGNNGYKNIHHHRRGHSWCDATTAASRRRSHDSNTLLVGIHNQLGPVNSAETPPHGKSYVKVNRVS